jgi:hypothetical protein
MKTSIKLEKLYEEKARIIKKYKEDRASINEQITKEKRWLSELE